MHDRDLHQLPQPLYTDHHHHHQRHNMKIKLKISNNKPNLANRKLKLKTEEKESKNELRISNNKPNLGDRKLKTEEKEIEKDLIKISSSKPNLDDRKLKTEVNELRMSNSKPKFDDRKLKTEETESGNYRNGEEEIESIESTRVVFVEKHQELVRACDFCGKTFSNGKALGGHRRIHLHGGDQIHKQAVSKKARIDRQQHQDHHHRNSSDQIHQNRRPIAPPDPNRTCCVCFKSFPSEKSLFGHMRFHPERTWRGVKPPSVAGAPASNNNSESTISDELELPHQNPDLEETKPKLDDVAHVDLIGSLTGWAQKNRRGKRSTYVDPSSPSDPESDPTDGSDRDRERGRYDNDSVTTDDVAAHSLLHLSRGTGIGYGRDHGSDVDDHDHKVAIGCGRDQGSSYRCGTCGRAFSTFQALGGHRSSHSKITINGGDQGTSLPDHHHHRQIIGCGEEHGNNGTVLVVQEHRCKICDRSFPSGQALGGHQRSHWAGPTTFGERHETTSSSGNAVLKRKLEIDLNEPAPEAEEEETGGFNNGLMSIDHHH